MQNISRSKLITISVILAVFIIGLIVLAIVIAVNKSGQNQFGSFIKIQNYTDKVKNVSKDIEDAAESSLYNTVKKNSANDFEPATVKDAVIRDNSDSQSFDAETNVYSGNFIVDMASIKQSYQVQYSYSVSNTIDTGGSPVIISCLNTGDLKYGTFGCKDLVSTQTAANDALLQYLPYSNFTFKISPDTTGAGGKLVLVVDLTIPDLDLSGDTASKAATMVVYKKEVTDWIDSKGVDATKYTYKYNYSDTGEFLGNNLDNNS